MFLVAGGLLVVFAALLGWRRSPAGLRPKTSSALRATRSPLSGFWGCIPRAVTGGSAPEDVFGPPGYAVAALGLLGLYPALADRSRWMAGIGAVAAAAAAVGWTILTVLSVLEVAGLSGAAAPEETALGAVALGATGLGMILGYPLFAIASLRSDPHPRTLGLLLLAPPIIFVAVFAVLAPLLGAGQDASWGPFIAGGAQAVAHLAIGFALRGETDLLDPLSRRGEPTTA